MSEDSRKPPSVALALVLVSTIFTIISVGLVLLLALPWFFFTSEIWISLVGLFCLILGFPLIAITLRTLSVSRALGKEIYQGKKESQLIKTGIYAYTRNPLYLSSFILFTGWSLFLHFTPLVIITILFSLLFIRVAKWEERELIERFSDEYRMYKERVPFFIPYPKR